MNEMPWKNREKPLTFTWHFKEKFARGAGLLIYTLHV